VMHFPLLCDVTPFVVPSCPYMSVSLLIEVILA
jgi:hypothetical protein